jgi:predicted nucleic acid-binding protein
MTVNRRYLFDTSSLLYVLKTRRSQKLDRQDCLVCDLTFYEFGNAVLNLATKRSEGQLLSEEQVQLLMQAFEKVSELMGIQSFDITSMSEIFKIARKEKITFYDASYLCYAKRVGCQLVTEDEKLAKAAENNSVDVTDADWWIKTR